MIDPPQDRSETVDTGHPRRDFRPDLGLDSRSNCGRGEAPEHLIVLSSSGRSIRLFTASEDIAPGSFEQTPLHRYAGLNNAPDLDA
jgi:hypothetical protein